VGLPIGLEPEHPLCGLGVRGAALEPASHEKIKPRGQSQLRRGQHEPHGVYAQVEWSSDVVAGVHLALLPVRRRERPCAGNYTLVSWIGFAASRKFDPSFATDMHGQSASRISGRTKAAVSAMCVRSVLIEAYSILKSAGILPAANVDEAKRREIQRVKCFVLAPREILAHEQFSICRHCPPRSKISGSDFRRPGPHAAAKGYVCFR
jgi:hypothetical protein